MAGASQEYHVRRATSADVEAMADLLAALFAIETEFVIDRAAQSRGLAMLLGRADAVLLCAEHGGRVVGMCSAQCLVSTATGGLSALVEDLVVHGLHRGRGVGTRLLASVERWAKEAGVTRLQLLVDTDNAPALAFYAGQCWDETRMMCRRKYV